jgi:ferrous iron transport protein A
VHNIAKARENIDLIFVTVQGGRGAMQRLADMGLVPGQRIRVLNNSGFGPVTILLKGARIALGYGLARKIIVEEKRNAG